MLALRVDRSLPITGILVRALACQGWAGWGRFLGVSGVEEGPGPRNLGKTALGGAAACSGSSNGDSAGGRVLHQLASFATLPEGLLPSTAGEGVLVRTGLCRGR